MNTAAAEAEEEPSKIVSLLDALMHEEDEQPKRHGSPLWMTTFADMITLLLAFFVLILSFSDLNVNRFKDVSGSLQKSLGKQDALPTVVAPPAETQLVAGPTKETAPLPEQLARDLGTLQKSLSMDLVGKKVQLRTENGKLVLQLPARGSGIMPQEMIDLYGRIADAQAQVESRVEIREGGEEDEQRNDTARQLKQLREMLASEIAKGEAQVERDGEHLA